MPFFKEHTCKSDQKVNSEIKKGELKLENLINRYRFVLVTILLIGDLISAHFADMFTHKLLLVAIFGLVFIYLGIYKIHKITLCEKPKPWLKYATIVLDYLVILVAIHELVYHLPRISVITADQTLLFGTIFFMIINSLSALRIHKHIIIISNILGISINTIVHYNFGSDIMIIIYTGTFIFVTGIFNQFIGRFVYNFYVNNFRLNEAMENVKQANEEIKTQNDELETQNEYLALQRDQIEYQKNQLTSSIEYASRIQKALIGTNEHMKTVFADSFVYFEPKDIVSGDFYWGRTIKANNSEYHLFSAIDCTGHGVPGAFLSMLGFSYLNEISSSLKNKVIAAEILNKLRVDVKTYLHQENTNTSVKDGMDMALCALNYETMTLQYAGANNPLYIIRKVNDGEEPKVEEYKADKMPIGVYIREKESFTNHEIKINKGDQLYLFSDGYWDQFGGPKGEKFKKRQFKELLLNNCHLPMSEQHTLLEQTMKNWLGDNHEQIDDITVMGVKI